MEVLMYLSGEEVKNLIECRNLVYDIPQLKNVSTRIEGSTYDFRLGKVFIPDPDENIHPFFGFDENGNEIRRLEKLREIEPHNGIYRFYGGVSYIIQSAETFNMIDGIGGEVAPKSSYFVALTMLGGTFIAPGFEGKLKAMLMCCYPTYIDVSQYYRIGCVKFFRHSAGDCYYYSGIWTGDKVTTDGKIERGY
jgi:deoxycytidine triphosphate deaminase